jgi:general secretion pathway protein K
VLWATAFLSIIAIALLRQTREDLLFAQALREDAKAEQLADAGVSRAMAILARADAGSPAIAADGSLPELRIGEGWVATRIEDDSGKIDLNQAGEDLLQALLAGSGVAPGEARRLAAAILDYRDPDEVRRPGGAEASDYAAAGVAARPRNGPFESVAELGQVLGMTAATLAALEPLVTVYSPTPMVNLAAAPPAVLRLLPGIDAGRLADAARRAPLRQRPQIVTVVADARTAGGGRFVRQAILRWTGGAGRPFVTLAWSRAWPAAAPPS